MTWHASVPSGFRSRRDMATLLWMDANDVWGLSPRSEQPPQQSGQIRRDAGALVNDAGWFALN